MKFFKRKSLNELREERKRLEQEAVSRRLTAETEISKKGLERIEREKIRELKYGGVRRTARKISGYARTAGKYGSNILEGIDKIAPAQPKTKRMSAGDTLRMPSMFDIGSFDMGFSPRRRKSKSRKKSKR